MKITSYTESKKTPALNAAKKKIKAVSKFFKKIGKAIANNYAPYAVLNLQTKKTHYAWTRKEALAWMACYNPKKFGKTVMVDYFGNDIAAIF